MDFQNQDMLYSQKMGYLLSPREGLLHKKYRWANSFLYIFFLNRKNKINYILLNLGNKCKFTPHL